MTETVYPLIRNKEKRLHKKKSELRKNGTGMKMETSIGLKCT